MPALPPWLDFNPQTFVGAAESARRSGQEDQRIGLERQQLAQSAAQAAGELALHHQQLDAQIKQQAIENQVAHEQNQQQFQQAQARQAVTDAYRQQQYGLAKQRLDQAAIKTVKVGNDVYSVNVNTGEMKKLLSGPGTGASGGTVKITEPASGGSEAVPGDPGVTARRGFPVLGFTGIPGLISGLAGLGPTIGARAAVPPTPGVPAAPGHPARTFSYHVPGGTSAADAFNMAQGGAPQTNSPTPWQPPGPDVVQRTGDSEVITPGAATLPKPGAVVNGYTFKGGDPANETNWVAVAAEK